MCSIADYSTRPEARNRAGEIDRGSKRRAFFYSTGSTFARVAPLPNSLTKEMSMSISMYDFSIPVLTRGLTNMSAILDKAAAHAVAKKFDSVVLAQARL